MKPIVRRFRSGSEQIPTWLIVSKWPQVGVSKSPPKLRVDRYRAHRSDQTAALYIDPDQYRPWINSRLLKSKSLPLLGCSPHSLFPPAPLTCTAERIQPDAQLTSESPR